MNDKPKTPSGRALYELLMADQRNASIASRIAVIEAEAQELERVSSRVRDGRLVVMHGTFTFHKHAWTKDEIDTRMGFETCDCGVTRESAEGNAQRRATLNLDAIPWDDPAARDELGR